MGKIMLKDLLQYIEDEDEPANRIQIVTGGQEWDSADELGADSELLAPFKEWVVLWMRSEESYKDRIPIIRAFICKSL